MHAVLLAGLLSGVPVPSSATSPFTFDIPKGWTNISSWAPPVTDKVPGPLLEEARKPDFVFFAANVEDGGFVENVNATIQECPGEITEEVMHELAKIVPAQVKSQMPLAEVDVLEHSVVWIGDVSAGRMVTRVMLGESRVGQVVYLLPNDGVCATVTYSAAADELDRYMGTFDAHAKATQGLVATKDPFSFDETLGPTGKWAAIGGGVALLVCLGLYFSRRS